MARRNTNLDRDILRMAASRASYAEISRAINNELSPSEVAVRVDELLNARDQLTNAQQRLLLIDELHELKDKLREMVVDNSALDHASTLLRTLQVIGDRLDKERVDVRTEMEQIRRAHASLMMGAINLFAQKLAIEIEKRHPEIDWNNEVATLVQTILPSAIQEIESRVARD